MIDVNYNWRRAKLDFTRDCAKNPRPPSHFLRTPELGEIGPSECGRVLVRVAKVPNFRLSHFPNFRTSKKVHV